MPKTKAKAKANKSKTIEAKSKGEQATTLRKLDPIAKRINKALAKADEFTEQAFDQRLVACLELGKAKVQCNAAKIKFSEWCEANVDKAYETVRKLATIGESGDEEKARFLLDDLRNRTRKAVAKSSAKRKEESASVGRTVNTGVSDSKPKPATPEQRALEATDLLKASDDNILANSARELAKAAGLAIQDKARTGDTLASVKASENKLSAVDKQSLLEWLASDLGAEFKSVPKVKPIAIDDGDGLDIPAKFDRRAPKKGKRGKKGAK